MKDNRTTTRNAVTTAAVLAMAGLALAGCKSSASASGSSGSSGSGSSSSAASSASASASTGTTGGTTTSLGTAYFPIQQGDTWVYTSSLSGVKNGTVTNKMTSVVPVSGGKRVRMSVTESADATAPTSLTYVFHDDGSITVPVTQFGNGTVKLKSGSVVWPSSAQLASGVAQHFTLVFQATVAGTSLREVARVAVKGGASRSVTVPAGTYHAQAIDETFSEKVENVPVSFKLVTWVANGVGPVKSELLGKGADAVPTTVEELTSFTKG
jgi:hypothetical protein